MIVQTSLKTIADTPPTSFLAGESVPAPNKTTDTTPPDARGFLEDIQKITKPKKEEATTGAGAASANEPNTAVERPVGITTFVDSMGTTLELQPANDSSVSRLIAPDTEADSIENFLNRPTFMNQLTWTSTQTAGTLLAEYKVPESIINLSTMKIQKMQYNQFLNCDMVIRIQASPIQLQAGRLWLCFEPYHDSRGARQQAGTIIQFTALHGISYDPCQPTPMELKIPFSSILSSWELTSAQFGCGSVLIYVLSQLRSATTTNSMTISIQGWLENTKVRVPTAIAYQAPAAPPAVAALQYQANMQEDNKAQKHVYSQFFSKIANVASALGNFPVLSSVAQPVAFFASAASNLAAYFGFSKPPDMSAPTKIISHNRANWTNSDAPLPLVKLSTSTENAIDHTGNHFPNPIDEMDISYIVSNPVMINQWEWSTSQEPGTLITVLPVHPGLCKILGTETDYSFGSYATGPCSYVASMFKYWAGSMKFKMEAVVTPFHAGRLVIAYVPDYTPLNIGINIQDIGNNYSVVWDIADSSHIEFEVPYLGNTPFLDVFLDNQTFSKLRADETDTEVVRDRLRKTTNGAIIVFVLNSLVSPAIASSTVNVMNWVAGGKDLTFAEPVLGAYKPVLPTAQRIDYTGKWYDDSEMSVAPFPVKPSGNATTFTYQSAPQGLVTSGVDRYGSTSGQKSNYKNFMPMHYIDPKERAKMCVGEVVTNLRVLTRRMTPAYAMYPQNVTTAGQWGNNATPPTSKNVLVFDPDYFGTGDGQGDNSILKKQIAPVQAGQVNWLTELDSSLSYISYLYAFARGSRIYGISAKPSNVINASAFGELADEIAKPNERGTFEFRLSSLHEEDTPPRQPYFRPEEESVGYNFANTTVATLSDTNYKYGFNSNLQGNLAAEKSGEAGCGFVVQVPPTSRYPIKLITTVDKTESEFIKQDKYTAPRSRRFLELRYRGFSSALSGGTSTYTPKLWPFPLTIMEAGADDFSFGGLIPPPIITKVAKTVSFPKYTTGTKVLL